MKFIFAGTPEFAVKPLRKLNEIGEISAVLTQPDRPKGRKGLLTPSPVKLAAEELGIPVLQPEKLGNELSALEKVGAEGMITCAYGQILTQQTLDLFPRGVWNIHASLLPAYRGAAPIARAIMDGCRKTGITIMKTELGLDTGDILFSRACEISERDTQGSLSETLSTLAADMLDEALARIEANAPLTKQGEGFVCKKVRRTEIDFSKSAREVSCLIRGLSPAPLAFGKLDGTELNFYFAEAVDSVDGAEEVPFGTVIAASLKEGLVVKCGEGAVRMTDLQPAGGKRMSARDFLNGRKLEKGRRFENESIL